jgi:hypothetical protein
VLNSVAELMGILTVHAVAAMETLFMYMGDGSALCAVAHCRAQTVDFQLLGLYIRCGAHCAVAGDVRGICNPFPSA